MGEMPPLESGHTFEFNRYRSREAVDFNGGSARPIFFEILCVDAVIGFEIVLHIG